MAILAVNLPVTSASADVQDMESLTPNHFLLGRPSVNLPLFWTQATDMDHRKAFRKAEAYADMIWSRWMKEYLPTLNKRTKWIKEDHNLEVGELVWLLEPSSKRSQYPLGRVIEVFAGDDGIVRSARIKTKLGEYTRPFTKLVPLEIQQSA